jgi:hypothetical protein
VPNFFQLDVLNVVLFVGAALSLVRLFFDFSKKQAKLIETIVVGFVAVFLVYTFITNLISLIEMATHGFFIASYLILVLCYLFFAVAGILLIIGNVLADMPSFVRIISVGVSVVIFLLYTIFGMVMAGNSFAAVYGTILVSFSVPLIYIGNFFTKEGLGIKLGKESEKTASQEKEQNDAQ